MWLQIFDVEHGACALVTCDDGTRMMIDAGHSAGGWSPAQHVLENGIKQIDMLAVTNYDEDHVSGLPALEAAASIRWLTRNKSVSADTLAHLKTEDGMGKGIDALCGMMRRYNVTPSPGNPLPSFLGLQFKSFCNNYPDFEDENNLSMILHLTCNGAGVLFTGDMEAAGWDAVLQKPGMIDALKATDIYVAPHHGRENGINETVFQFCKPKLIVISDKGYAYETQKTVPYYESKSVGAQYEGRPRKVLTTRNDGHIAFQL